MSKHPLDTAVKFRLVAFEKNEDALGSRHVVDIREHDLPANTREKRAAFIGRRYAKLLCEDWVDELEVQLLDE